MLFCVFEENPEFILELKEAVVGGGLNEWIC